ncbi:Bug family tripartite tricarboxylate transporter substrate binding protein [Bordetella sp. 2513F-2]
MRLSRRIPFSLAALLCALSPLSPAAAQDAYPAREIRAVVPFPAGGINDTIGRLLFKTLSDKLGASIVVENKPGAGGTIGTQAAAKSPADGYTVLLGAASTIAVAPNLYKNVGYSVSRDFTAIGGIASVPSVIIVAAQSPYRQWPDLVAAERARPGMLTYGSAGSGTSHHVQAELLNIRAQTRFMHVPYRGGAPAMTDLIGGQIDLMVDPLPTTLANAQAQRVRPLAITTETRSPLLPDVPTLKELGLDYNASTWFGLFAPAGTPAPVVAKLGAALQAALQDPALSEAFKTRGIEPLPLARQDFDNYVQSENATWAEVIQKAGIEVQ